MKTEDEEKTILPEELSHLEEPLKEARAKIEAIDTQINNTRPDRGPQSAYRPPFHGSPFYSRYPTHSQSNDSKIAGWNKEKAQIKDDFFKRLDDGLENLDPDKAKKVKEVVDYQLSDNKYKTGIEKDGQKQNGEPFERIESIYYERYSFDKKKDVIVTEPDKNQAAKSDIHSQSTSKEYKNNEGSLNDKEVTDDKKATAKVDIQSKNTPSGFMAQYQLPKSKEFSENAKDVSTNKNTNVADKNDINKLESQSKNTPQQFMSQYNYRQAINYAENSKDITEKKNLAIDKDLD